MSRFNETTEKQQPTARYARAAALEQNKLEAYRLTGSL